MKKKDESVINPNISLMQKFLEKGNSDSRCYTISGRMRSAEDRLNILFIGSPDSIKTVGNILNESDRFGGAVIFAENYGASRWMESGQVDLIVGHDLEAGEADWLGKCYDAARMANVPLCVEFLVGRNCDSWKDFGEKFKSFMETEFYKQKNQLEQEPSDERMRKITDREIGWRGKELISSLTISKELATYLNRLEITSPQYPLKGTMRDLVYNFVMMVDGKPVFAGTDEKCGPEIKFILEQLGYLPRPQIDRGSLQIDPGMPLSNEVIKEILESSIKKYAHKAKISFDSNYIELIKGIRPDNRTDENTDVTTYNLKSLQKMIGGSYGPDTWFDDSHRFTFCSDKSDETKISFAKNSVVRKWFPGAYDYRLIKVDRKLLETLIRVEEALRIPHFAYEAILGGLWGKESKIPLQQIS